MAERKRARKQDAKRGLTEAGAVELSEDDLSEAQGGALARETTLSGSNRTLNKLEPSAAGTHEITGALVKIN